MELRTKTTELDAKGLKTAGNDSGLGDGIIAEFTAVVTSRKEDRDFDVMEPNGAAFDLKQPLLWQHDANQPVGKLIGIVERDDEKVIAKYAVLNTALGRDALTLMKAGVLRISHGFRPLEIEPRKNSSGYHVRKFEVVETSLVSVPANTDAEIVSLTTKSFESQPVKAWVEQLKQKGNATMETTTQTPPAGTKAGTIDTEAIKNAVKEGMTAAFLTITKDANGNFVVANGNGGSNGADGNGQRKTGVDLLNAAGSNGGTDVRVKSVSEKYGKETRTLKHFKTGETVKHADGREPQSASELHSAMSGALMKRLAQKAGAPIALSDEDQSLLELCYGEKWCGHVGNDYQPEIDGLRMKTLLSDSVSGGTSAVPYWFDVDLISFPLLSGEIFPYVDLRNVPRGNSVHGASVANPTVQWGIPEGTDIPLFDTASLVSALNTNIATVTAAITVGLDFLADSPADVGRILTENVGQRLAAELDKVVAVGNGTSQPTGIFTASGLVSVNADNTTSGPPTLNDYESLLFGIKKQYRAQAMRPMFISNDVSYQRSRQIRVDPHALTGGGTLTINQLPVMNPLNDIGNYQTLAHRHAISYDVGNSDIAFAAMARYRMYRRLGFELRWVTEGAELARRNEAMLVVRGRFGGMPVDGSAFAIITDGQS